MPPCRPEGSGLSQQQRESLLSQQLQSLLPWPLPLGSDRGAAEGGAGSNAQLLPGELALRSA